MISRGQTLELVLACIKSEGDSGSMLNICNVMESCQNLSVPRRVGVSGRRTRRRRRRRVHCLWRVVYCMERGGCEGERKETGLEREFLPVTFHFQVMRALCRTKKLVGTVFMPLRWIPRRKPVRCPAGVCFSDWTITGIQKSYMCLDRGWDLDYGLDTCCVCRVDAELFTHYPDPFVVSIYFFFPLCVYRAHFPSSQSSVAYLVSLTIILSIAISYFWTGQSSRQPRLRHEHGYWLPLPDPPFSPNFLLLLYWFRQLPGWFSRCSMSVLFLMPTTSLLWLCILNCFGNDQYLKKTRYETGLLSCYTIWYFSSSSLRAKCKPTIKYKINKI